MVSVRLVPAPQGKMFDRKYKNIVCKEVDKNSSGMKPGKEGK